MGSRLFKIVFSIFSLCCLFLYIVGASTAYIPSPAWWGINVIGLLFPLLVPVVLACGLVWLLLNRKMALVCFLVLACGVKTILYSFALHSPKNNLSSGMEGLTILSYNVREFSALYKDYWHAGPDYKDLLQPQNADIVCMQEFATIELGQHTPNNSIFYFQEQLRLPYYYFSNDLEKPTPYHYTWNFGSMIYSRFPFIDTGKITDEQSGLRLIYADIAPGGGDTIRIMTAHLQSFGLNATDYAGMHQTVKKGNLQASKPLMYKLRMGFTFREEQAAALSKIIQNSPYPVIVCGDFNTTPASTAYHTIRGNLQDAFLEKGNGLGRTYYRLSPTLRIDYIFADPRFKVNSFHVMNRLISDHYPVVANISMQ